MGDGGKLIPFPSPAPTTGTEVEPAGEVLEGELLSDEESAAVDERLHGRKRVTRIATRVIALVVVPGEQETTTKAVGRAGLSTAVAVCQGIGSWRRRAWDAGTMGVYRRQIRTAESAGNVEQLAEWIDRQAQAKERRHKHMMDLPQLAVGAVKALGVATIGLLAVLLFLGLLAQVTGAGSFVGFFRAVLTLTGWGAAAVAVVWVPLLVLSPLFVLVAAWREGKRVGDPPRWLLTPDQRLVLGAEITPSKVIVALRDLGVPALRAALKEAQDAGAGLLGPIAIAGCGVEVEVRLPSGVSTDQIQARRRRLAENLDRHEHEVFITVSAARTVRLWIADPGALDQPIGPSPLVTDPTMKANMRTGKAPWGQNLRGDRVAISLWQRHVLVTGLSNQGKTKTGRALALWLALDIRVEFRLADLKGFGDWDMFADLATVYIKGPADEHVIAAAEMLEQGVAEMKRRLVSGREIWDPLMLIVDEAQVAYMCPALGPDKRPYGGKKNTSRFFMAVREIENQGRAVNVLVWQFTQDPTDQNLPKLVREGAHIRASLVVGTEEQSRMALGDKAVDGGAAPHLLRQGLDKGTVVVAGDGVELPPGEPSITVRTYFVDDDQAWVVARRAIERRRKAGKIPHEIDSTPVVVDHLVDIHVAMREEKRVRTVVVLGRLIEDINPPVYEAWGHEDLANAVRKYLSLGLDIRKYRGDSVLRLEEVRRALERRE